MVDAIEALVEHAARAQLRDLPPGTVERARLMVLDTLGVTLAGSRAQVVVPLLAQVREWGGRPEASVLVSGDRLPGPVAAMVNAVMARSLDFDDCDEETGYHPGVAAVPAALAAAEMSGDVSGADLLVAVAVAVDAVLRVRKAVRLRMGAKMPWTSGTFAPLTAAFAAGRALRLEPDTLRNALGIAYTELSGTPQSHLDGGVAHAIHLGAAVQAGLVAVALARRGVTGARNVLEGRFGLFNAYHYGEYDRERLLDGLGREYRIEDVSIKPFPCCKMTHGAVQAMLQARADGVSAGDVRGVTVRVNEPAFILCSGQPWRPPKTLVEAQFSIPYVAGAALARGRVTLEEFTQEAMQSPDVLDVAGRMRVVRDPSIDALGLQVAPTEVEVTLRGGEVRRYRIERVPGHPASPMGFDAVLAKFMDCVRFAAPETYETTLGPVVDAVRLLEAVPDVRSLIRPLAPLRAA